jgi:hypothetical protein
VVRAWFIPSYRTARLDKAAYKWADALSIPQTAYFRTFEAIELPRTPVLLTRMNKGPEGLQLPPANSRMLLEGRERARRHHTKGVNLSYGTRPRYAW